MVKFSFIALASALATVNAGSSVRKTIKLGNRALRRGDPATEALLQKARPYKKNAATPAAHRRRLDDADAADAFDGSYSLKFSQCIDAKTYDEDLFDDEMIAYVQAGQVVSVKSYVLFHVCQGDDCYYESDDDVYMVDLATYMANVATYHANKRTDYCEQCEEFDDYCNAEEEEDAEEADEAEEDAEDEEAADEEEEADEAEEEQEEDNQEEEQEEEGDNQEEGEEENNEGEEEGEENNDEGEDAEERKLKKKTRKLIERKLANKEYIDCDQCAAYECYADEEDLDDQAEQAENKNELDENVSAWIADLAECKESGVQWNGIDLYIGAMCSPYGDGVELAVFVNEDCTMYTNQKSFSSVWNPYNDNENGSNYLMYAEEFIKNAFSEVTPCLQQEFADPDEEDNGDEDEEQEYEMNAYCQEVLEGDIADFNNCAVDEDNADEDNDDTYNWYTYDLKEADDVNGVCEVLNQMAGEYSYIYDEEASGTWYNRNKKGQIVNGAESEGMALSPAIITGIVCVCLAVIGGAAFLLKPKKKHSDSNEPVYQGGTML
mmetsp:Transcript_1765/g.3789  ORF Transcript_1765/g.3789 Transcript_1765/m.3789 type:complete len:549 (+) Transcript_1765:55-1701(+)